jgi:hypothetical protein
MGSFSTVLCSQLLLFYVFCFNCFLCSTSTTLCALLQLFYVLFFYFFTKAFDLLFVLNRLVRMISLAELPLMTGDHVSEGGESQVVGQSELPGHASPKFREAFGLADEKS